MVASPVTVTRGPVVDRFDRPARLCFLAAVCGEVRSLVVRMRCTWLAAAALLAAPRVARAEPDARAPPFRASIEYSAPAGCPGAADFEAIVVERLGFDPFSEVAPNHVLVLISATEQTLEGRLEWRDEGGRWAGDQRFPARTLDCPGLARTMGLALAVQINLLTTVEPSGTERDTLHKPSPPAPESAPTRPQATPVAVVGAEHRREHTWAFAFGAGGTLALGVAPEVGVFARVFGSAAKGPWSFELGGEVSTLAVEQRGDGAGYSQWLWLASAAACGSEEPLRLCLVIKGGVVNVAGRIDVPASPRGAVLQTGLRLGLRQGLGRRLFLAERVEGLVNVTRWSVTLDALPVWTAPVAAGTLGLDVGVVF